MGQDCSVSVWGVRGAFPAAERDFLEYGGNTSCLSVDFGGQTVVLDAGSGLVRLGEALVRSGQKRVDILFSHVHLDHVMGLFTFPALHEADMEVHLYGEARCGVLFRRQLETLVGPPYWPLGLNDFPAQIQVHEIGPGQRFSLAGAEVFTLRGEHPDQSLLYRLEWGGRSVVYALDCEMNGDMFQRLTAFARGSSLIVWDANFAPGDLRAGWGHSTWEQGLDLLRASGAEQILMTHYCGDYTDDLLLEQERLARRACPACRFAREGMSIEV